jgi:predicted kinase
MEPEDVAAVAGPAGLSFERTIELPPYHHAAVFTKLPARSRAPITIEAELSAHEKDVAITTANGKLISNGKKKQEEEANNKKYYLAEAAILSTPLSNGNHSCAGLSGTGKTTLAGALALEIEPAPGAVHLRSDLERKSLFQVQETARLGSQSYSSQVSEQVYETLRRKARLILEAGHSVIVDAVKSRPEERLGVERAAAELGLPFGGLWLQAEPQRLIESVTARRDDASDATASVVRQQSG